MQKIFGIPAIGEYKDYLIEIDEYNNVNVKNKLNGNIQIRKITLNTESKILKPNETFKLEAIIEPDNATNKNVIWTSDNEDVATVTQDGIVTAKVDGTANIKVEMAIIQMIGIFYMMEKKGYF